MIRWLFSPSPFESQFDSSPNRGKALVVGLLIPNFCLACKVWHKETNKLLRVFFLNVNPIDLERGLINHTEAFFPCHGCKMIIVIGMWSNDPLNQQKGTCHLDRQRPLFPSVWMSQTSSIRYIVRSPNENYANVSWPSVLGSDVGHVEARCCRQEVWNYLNTITTKTCRTEAGKHIERVFIFYWVSDIFITYLLYIFGFFGDI